MADSAVRDALRHESTRLELAVVGGDDSPAARAVKLMYETGDYDGITLTPSDEHEAIELLAGMGKFYLFDELVAGAERLSESIHSVATRGLQEVVQNAEDQRASTVRFGYRKGRKGGGELLVAHDGKPVELRDVLRMSLPLISGSREDAEKIGQFGVGLKTLKQLGRELQVHCRPLPSFSIEDGRIKPVTSARPISGFWNADARETLFVLSLKDKDFDLAFFEKWIARWDASSLLFLDHVSSVALIDLGRAKEDRQSLPSATGVLRELWTWRFLGLPRFEKRRSLSQEVTAAGLDTSRGSPLPRGSPTRQITSETRSTSASRCRTGSRPVGST